MISIAITLYIGFGLGLFAANLIDNYDAFEHYKGKRLRMVGELAAVALFFMAFSPFFAHAIYAYRKSLNERNTA